MNTQILVIPPTARDAQEHPGPVPAIMPLIAHLAASHAALLSKWNCKFALASATRLELPQT